MKLLHTMLRVGNLQRSIDFYTKAVGMTLLRTTYNYGVESYESGTAFGHIAIGVDDVAATCERVRQAGGVITREAGPVKGGSTIIAFFEDPDHYKIELIQTSTRGL